MDALGQFDVVLFVDVIEHMTHPGPVLQFARGLLAPGGKVLVSVPNVAHWTIRMGLARGRFDYRATGLMDATHVRWFTKTSLERLLVAAGYQQIGFDWTCGTFLGAYGRLPLLLTRTWRMRRRFVARLVSRWPTLFGFQHIVTAS
jgi:SAM-dependent methyltransferase